MRRYFVIASFVALTLSAPHPVRSAVPDQIDFQRDVRPILSGHCFKCHGPDEATRKADLRLDQRDSAIQEGKSGYTAIVPGKPDESELVFRILDSDDDIVMPPPSTKNPLTDEQKEILKKWVQQGAEYDPHWAYQKPERPELPEVKNREWPRNAIDHFVLARLEEEGLKPSSEADKYTLARRVYLDLIGLPPTPEQADEFVNDPSPNAYEKMVDGLLNSKHYGERWARRWLDLARYADTNGYEKDRPRSIWPYRDWVIEALNRDMPFDQFTIEQIAGDMLPDATLDQKIATGFHRNSMINEEGGNDPQEYRFYSMVDRVHVTATTWLGMTMSCAQCHTHKYDPIPHEEYYQFMAFLNNADEPRMDVPQPDIQKKRQEQMKRIEEMERALVSQFPPRLKASWLTPAEVEFKSESGRQAEPLSDGSFLVKGDPEDKDTYTVSIGSAQGPVTHLQLQVLPDESLPANGPGWSDSGNFVLTGIEVKAAPQDNPDQLKEVKVSRASADFSQDGFPAWHALNGNDQKGWGVSGDGNWHVTRTLTLDFEEPVEFDTGARFTIRLAQNYGKKHVIGRFRVGLGSELPDDRPMEERRREHLDYRLAQWLDKELEQVVEWTPAEPVFAEGSFPTLTIEDDNTVFVSGDFTKRDTYRVNYNGDWRGVTAVRIEVLTDERLPNNGPGRVDYEGPFGDFFMSDVKLLRDGAPFKISSATDSYHSGGNSADKAIDDNFQSGWSINGGQGRDHNAVFVFDQPLDFQGVLELQMVFERYYAAGLGKFRMWVTRDEQPKAAPHPNDVRESLLALNKASSETERVPHLNLLRRHYVTIAPELGPELEALEQARNSMPDYPTTLVMAERPEGHTRTTHLHKRGEFLQPVEKVQPAVPSVLPDLPEDAPRNRLGFAQWLVSPENPLTPRVVMNRHWEAFFGRGIVSTMEDFGFQGELPSHPELLDWLATEFIRQDWSLKSMHKLIVMSATYRQSSRTNPELLERDPQNVLLARGPRFRLEAELIRDQALVASGLFTEEVGGPSVYPPQPASITTEGAYGRLSWAVSQGEDRYRRGLYTFAKRTAPFAMFDVFDAPSGEACVAERDRSNTPLQSLTLLNDEMFVEMAQALGREVVDSGGSVEERATRVFRRFLTRPPTDTELDKLVAFYNTQLKRLEAGELDAAELLGGGEGEDLNEKAAWAAVARVIMNLDETVTKS